MTTMKIAPLAALLLVGCTAATNLYTTVPQKGQTAQQAQADAVACEAVAYKAKEKPTVLSGSLTGWWLDEHVYKREYRDCMTARGYNLKDE